MKTTLESGSGRARTSRRKIAAQHLRVAACQRCWGAFGIVSGQFWACGTPRIHGKTCGRRYKIPVASKVDQIRCFINTPLGDHRNGILGDLVKR